MSLQEDGETPGMHIQRKDHLRMQSEGSHLQANEKGLWRKRTCLFLALPALKTEKINLLLLKPLSLWYFVMVDWANEHSHLCTIKPIQRWFFLGVFIPSWTAACVWETFKDEPGHSQSDSHYFIIRKKWSP